MEFGVVGVQFLLRPHAAVFFNLRRTVEDEADAQAGRELQLTRRASEFNWLI